MFALLPSARGWIPAHVCTVSKQLKLELNYQEEQKQGEM